jgi:hypothetical protein
MTPYQPTEPTDADRLKLLDRIAERMPDLDLKRHSIEWTHPVRTGSRASVAS